VSERGCQGLAAEVLAVVAKHPLQPPAGRAQLLRHPPGELRGLPRGRVAPPADDELRPGEGGAEVDRRQLPDRAFRAAQAADVEAVDPDQLARPVDLDVGLRRRLGRRLVGGTVAGDQREALGSRVEAVPAQTAPDPVRRDDDPAPARAAKLGGDPPGTEPGWPSAKATIRSSTSSESWLGIFGRRRSRGRSTSSPCRSTCAFQLVGRAVDAEGAAGGRDSDTAGEIEQLQPVAEEDIILRHATRSFRLATKRA